MAEQQPQQDRTEQATPKRREEARRKGDVPRSRELTMAWVMLSGAAALLGLAAPMGETLIGALSDALVIERAVIFDDSQLAVEFAKTAGRVFAGLAPLGAILLAAVLLGAVMIGGWSFSLQAVSVKLERVNPAKGIKRIFSVNSLNELLKALGKFSVIALIAVAWLWYSVDELAGLGREPAGPAIAHAMKICGVALLIMSSGLLVIAAVDVPFQLWQYQKKLRMTRQQVKDEFKETEGRPEVKSKIRLLQQQVAARRMMEALPSADVVLTNPTHVAVALRYDETSMGAPRVIAKGKELVAARIREIAEENGIPLFSAPPLARVLFRTTEVGEEIPAKLYEAVAQVLAYIYQVRDSIRYGSAAPRAPVPAIDEGDF